MQNEQAINETDNRNLCHFQMAVKVGVNGNQSFRYDPYAATVYTDLLAEDAEDMIPGQQDNVAITAESEHPALRRLWNLTRPYREMFDKAEMEANEGFVPIEDPHAKQNPHTDVNERTAINQQSPALDADAGAEDEFAEEQPIYREQPPVRSVPTHQSPTQQKPEGYYTREDIGGAVLINTGQITIEIYHSLLIGLMDKNDPNLAMINNVKEQYDRLYDAWDL